MGKKFVKTTFAILSFMMLLPTSVFAEDAGNMEAAFVGESVLEADQSASYSDADSTLPFEEEKTILQMRRFRKLRNRLLKKRIRKIKILTWMNLYQETLLLRTKRRQSMS